MPKAIKFERTLSRGYATMLGALNKDGWNPDPALNRATGNTNGNGHGHETGYLSRLRRSFLFGQ